MPIVALLQKAAFDPETTHILTTAFDKAAAKRGKRHGDHQERQLLAVRNGVHRMQGLADCTRMVGARERRPRPPFLVLRQLRSFMGDQHRRGTAGPPRCLTHLSLLQTVSCSPSRSTTEHPTNPA